MDDMFKGYLPEGENPDIQIYIFPHLREFLVIDLRMGTPEVTLLESGEVFGEPFYETLEQEFSFTARQENQFPFAHLMNLPLRLEETIRAVAMNCILDRLGIDYEDEEEVPSIVVFVISGGALAMHSEKLIDSVQELLGTFPDQPRMEEWKDILLRLVRQENQALQEVNQMELSEALASESPDYFSLWENRN